MPIVPAIYKSEKMQTIIFYRGREVPCHFAFLISIFQLLFSTLHSIFHITTSIFHFPTSKADPVAFTGHLQAAAGCQPIMRIAIVCAVFTSRVTSRPCIVSSFTGRIVADRPCVLQFSNFQSRNGTLRHLRARWLTDYAHCKCLIIRTLRMVGQPPSL